MKARDFCFWLKGVLEVSDPDVGLTPKQAELVKRHLYVVFEHEIDMSADASPEQAKLDKVHGPGLGMGGDLGSLGADMGCTDMGCTDMGGMGGLPPHLAKTTDFISKVLAVPTTSPHIVKLVRPYMPGHLAHLSNGTDLLTIDKWKFAESTPGSGILDSVVINDDAFVLSTPYLLKYTVAAINRPRC